MTTINFADLDSDTSRPNLAPIWDALDTPTYRVLDEEGVNVASAQIRKLTSSSAGFRATTWLYVDDTDGYCVMDDDDAKRLLVVLEEHHEPRGFDKSGNVIDL